MIKLQEMTDCMQKLMNEGLLVYEQRFWFSYNTGFTESRVVFTSDLDLYIHDCFYHMNNAQTEKIVGCVSVYDLSLYDWKFDNGKMIIVRNNAIRIKQIDNIEDLLAHIRKTYTFLISRYETLSVKNMIKQIESL